jgi:hypothetical protein
LEGILIVVEGWFTAERNESPIMTSGWGDASWCNIHNTIHGTLAIQTMVLTDRFYSLFQLLIRPPFSFTLVRQNLCRWRRPYHIPRSDPPNKLLHLFYRKHIMFSTL